MKDLNDDHLPARRRDIRELQAQITALAEVVLRIDISLNPCPLSKATSGKAK